MSRLPKTISVEKLDNSVLFTFAQNQHYLYDGTIEVPFNSLSIIADKSEAITLRKSASNDIFISAPWQNFDINASSKEEAVDVLTDMLYDETGGGVSREEVQDMIDAATSGIPSSQVIEQLRNDVNTVSGTVDTKQDKLTAGENITISGNVISAEAGNNIIELTQAEYDALETKDPDALYIITDAQEINMNDYYTKSEVDASIATKADTSALTAVQDSLSGYVTTTTYVSGQYATAKALNALQENKLDASAYTPTDLSEYWTSGQTQEAINAATSGIPSSQVVEQLRTDVNTISGDVQNNTSDIADIYDTIDLKEEVIASALTEVRQDVADIDAKEEVIASALTEVNQALNNKLDASAYTPTDLSQYWTSGQTQNAINAATSGIPSSQVIEALRNDLNTVSGEVDTKQDALEYYTEDTSRESATIMVEKYDGAGNKTENRVSVGGGGIIFENYNETDDGGISGTIGAQVDIRSLGLFISAYSDDGENESRTELEVKPMGAYINSEPIATEPYVDAATSGKADTSALTAVNGALTTHTADTTVHVSQAEKATWNAKADASAITSIESSITAVSNDLNTLSGAVIDNEYTVSQAINSLNNRVTAVESGGSVTVDTTLDSGSTNPVANSAITNAIDAKADASTTYTKTEINNLVNNKFWCGTQAQYDALATKENDVLYLIHL